MNNDKIIDNKEKWEDLEEAVQVPDTEIPRKRNPFKLSDEQIAEMQRQLNRNKLLKKNKDDKEEKEDDEEILREDKEPTSDNFIEELKEYKTFSGIEFEKNIPHTMRFKEYDIIYEDPYTLEPDRNDLYWVTQQFFSKEELKQFAKAFKELNIFDRALVTVRDLSTYVISTDEAKGVLAIIDKDGNINDTGYVNTLNEIGYNFDYETGEWKD